MVHVVIRLSFRSDRDVAHDADDLTRSPPCCHALAYGVDTRKQPCRQRLANEDATGRRRRIAAVERATRDDANADCLEIVARDDSLLRRDTRPRSTGQWS